jgi:hypothetical protein
VEAEVGAAGAAAEEAARHLDDQLAAIRSQASRQRGRQMTCVFCAALMQSCARGLDCHAIGVGYGGYAGIEASTADSMQCSGSGSLIARSRLLAN